MFIVWRGWGLLVLPIIVVVTGAVTMGLDVMGAAMGLPKKFELFAMFVGLLAAAAANWFIGKRFNDVPGRQLLDEKTGQRIVLKPRHDFFFIKMEYWSVLVALAALFVLITMFT